MKAVHFATIPAAALLAANLAWGQGNGSGHGGNLVLCANKPAVILDYYHATLPSFGTPNPRVLDISRMSNRQVVDAFRERLKGTALLRKFDRAIEILKPIDHWIVKELKDVGDSNEPYALPADCSRVQVAMREGDTMYVDPRQGPLLSPAQRGMLEVHEALYYVSGHRTSEKVRNLIRALMVLDTPAADVERAVREIGSPFHLFEDIFPRIQKAQYVPEKPIPQGLKSAFLKFRSGTGTQPTLTADYFSRRDAFSSDSPAGTFTLACNREGTSCEVQPGGTAGGWSPGCKFQIGPRGVKLVATCPGQETQTYYRD
ncbi:MAG TPA: hypothetical protein VM598_08080 [Bdellovibrionota bacterium]|nr:hypothetical protein [Bdellovibrionota bacterium]